MESLSGGDATAPFQDGAGDQGYPVNSSCPSTSRALSIPEIRERIVNLAMSPDDKSSFCRLRAVGRAWRETTFELAKKQEKSRFWLPLSRGAGARDRLRKTRKFLEKVTPDALWIPIDVVCDINRVNIPLATRVAEDYSHLIVELVLEISEGKGALSDLAQKLEVFQGRDYSRLQTVKLLVHKIYEAPVEELQKNLDAIERLTGSLTELMHFHVTLWCSAGEEAQVILPSRITELTLDGRDSLNIHPGNTLPRLQVLNVEIYATSERQTNLCHFLEHCKTLKKLKIWRAHTLLAVVIFLPELKSLNEISLDGINYVFQTGTGSDVLPNLSTAELYIQLNLEEGEVAQMAALGKLFRKAIRFTLFVTTSLNASPRMELVSECFSNVTKLHLTNVSGWKSLIRPLSHVFLRMTTLREIEIAVEVENKYMETPLDLCRLLTGLEESEIPEEEKATILNGRKDVLTNLYRLRSLTIATEGQFQPVSPFLFDAVFNSMPELTKIKLNEYSNDDDSNDEDSNDDDSNDEGSNDREVNLFINVQDMIRAWRASGKLID